MNYIYIIVLIYGEINSSSCSGGIVGYTYTTVVPSEIKDCIFNSYNSGDIIGVNSAGGIVGKFNNDGGAVANGGIYNCYNLGSVKPEKTIGQFTGSGGIYGSIRGVNISLTLKNSFMLTGTNSKVGSSWGHNVNEETTSTYDYINASIYSKDDMLSTDFIDDLNSYITANSDGVDMNNCARWIQGSDGFPTLDFNTIWNESKWITK